MAIVCKLIFARNLSTLSYFCCKYRYANLRHFHGFLFSGNGVGGARVVLLSWWNRTIHHHTVSTPWFHWSVICLIYFLLTFSFQLVISTAIFFSCGWWLQWRLGNRKDSLCHIQRRMHSYGCLVLIGVWHKIWVLIHPVMDNCDIWQ